MPLRQVAALAFADFGHLDDIGVFYSSSSSSSDSLYFHFVVAVGTPASPFVSSSELKLPEDERIPELL